MVCLVGCEAAKSANPTAPSVAGPIPGVNITAPRAARAVAGSTLTFSGEPQTLLIENPGTSGVAHLWLQLEVGTDAGFPQIVHQADQIALGGNGRTVVPPARRRSAPATPTTGARARLTAPTPAPTRRSRTSTSCRRS